MDTAIIYIIVFSICAVLIGVIGGIIIHQLERRIDLKETRQRKEKQNDR